ncbi:MAG TPA: glycosyltransferase family 87 protein [Mycobacterium sp.]
MTGAGARRVTVSPQPLAADLRSVDGRDFPSRTDPLGRALSDTIGGPVGRHALIGRARFLTPVRVMFMIGVIFLALGWATKAPCLQTVGAGTADQRVANWDNERGYRQLCYSDTVPLYGAELLSQGKFPYKSSWLETDHAGRPQVRYDGLLAVRYMEYPVLTGVYQYMAMALAKTYTAVGKVTMLPVLNGVAEVVVFFDIAALGLALAWLATVWATAGLAGRRIWDAALVAASPLVIFQIFTNFDALATGLAVGGLLAWARRKPVLAGILIGLGAAAKLYPVLFLGPLLVLGLRTGRLREVGRTAAATAAAWLAVNLPVLLAFPRGWSEFFRLNTRRGDDMDSLFNVVRSFTGWPGLDPHSGFWEPPLVLNIVVGVLFALCCAGIGYVTLTAPTRPRLAQLAFLVVAAFLLTNKVWSPQFSLWLVPLAVLAVPHWRLLLAWMTVDALVWVPRMYYLYSVRSRGLPEQWFTATVLLRDIAVAGLCVLVLRQIYRPAQDLVRWRGRQDDPAGGVFDRAADAPPAWLPARLWPRAAVRAQPRLPADFARQPGLR